MRIGGHVSTAGGIATGLQRGADIGCDAIQIFTQSPRMWKPYAYTDEALDGYAEAEAASPIDGTYCHATYLINLATENEKLAGQSFECLVNNLATATRIGSRGVVLHVGSHLGAGFESIVGKVSDHIERALDATEVRLGRASCPLVLENAAGSGGTVGRSFEELAALIEGSGGDERLGICIDTQHLFASGIGYSNRAEADAVIDRFDEVIGLDRLKCLHLNDSKVALGSNRDRHENLGDGEIGNKALGLLISHPALEGIPALLEVPGDGDGPRAEDVVAARKLLVSGRRSRRQATKAR